MKRLLLPILILALWAFGLARTPADDKKPDAPPAVVTLTDVITGMERLEEKKVELRLSGGEGRQNPLTAPRVLVDEPTAADRDLQIDAKAALQFEQEWAEHEVNVARDRKMLENLLALWDEAGPEKVAVLNAGSSHQWRIARQLPDGIGYYHVEQP
jgi:hypothetical protein